MSIVVSVPVHLFRNTKAAAWGGASIFFTTTRERVYYSEKYMGTTRGRSAILYFLPLQDGASTICKNDQNVKRGRL